MCPARPNGGRFGELDRLDFRLAILPADSLHNLVGRVSNGLDFLVEGVVGLFDGADPVILHEDARRGRTMTEEDWLQSLEPELMVTTLSYHLKLARTKNGRRKLLLFGCACCRRVVHLFPDESWSHLVNLAENLSEGTTSQSELDAALGDADLVPQEGEADHVWQARNCLHLALGRLCKAAATAALACVWINIALRWLRADEVVECAVQANLLRCIFGNPFQPPLAIQPTLLDWNGGAVVGLARAIDAERRFDDMPVLADALEEAGCSDEEVLGHLRGPGPHCRGCHALDTILGKR
jgi:hypothetical protein